VFRIVISINHFGSFTFRAVWPYAKPSKTGRTDVSISCYERIKNFASFENQFMQASQSKVESPFATKPFLGAFASTKVSTHEINT
jgi:hypothetical protein